MNEEPRSMNPWSRRARFARTTRLSMGAAAIGLLAACSSESLTTPTARPNNDLTSAPLAIVTGTVTNVTGLLRTNPVLVAVTRSRTFDRNGGQLDIPELGFSLQVPAGAFRGDTLTVSVTAIRGRMVAYNFEPHGTTFLKPLTFSQQLLGTNGLVGTQFRTDLAGGYFKSDTQLNTTTNSAAIDEVFGIMFNGTTASFDIRHFSGYMVSTGRSAPADGEPQ